MTNRLSDNWHSKSDSRSYRGLLLDDNELDFDDDFYVIGDRVYVDGHRPGSVAYFGETEFGSGDWVGVVLDDPTGNHNGKLHGREYFQCAPSHGLFVRTHRVSRISDSALGSSATSSRCATPLPTFQRQRHDYIKRYLDDGTKYGGYDNLAHLEVERPRDYKMMSARNSSPMDSRGSQRQTRPSSRVSNGSSLLDTYYYDEDYRQDRVPTVASLARKLKSMGDREEERQQQQREHREQELQRPLSRATSLSSSASPIGILKRHSSHHSSSGGGGGSSSSNNNNNNSSSRLQFADDNNDERVPLSPPANFGSRVDDLNRRLRANSASPSSSPRYVFNFRPKREQLSTNNARPPAEASDNYGKSKRSVYLSAVDPPQKGDRVLIRTEREGELSGVLRFMGETNFATGEWAGIELDDPVGKNDGTILGCRYFYCPKNYGLFVPATRVRKRPDNRHEMLSPEPQLSSLSSQARNSQYSSSNPSIFGSMRSTIKSPPPLTGLSRYSSGSRSTTPSYDMGTLSPTSTSSPSSKQHSNTDASRQQAANYYPEYSGSSYPTSMTPSSLEESRRSNDGDCSGRISPVAPKRDSSLNDRYSLFSDTPSKSRTYDNNFKSSASSTSLFNSTDSAWRPKFDDRDIEIQLNRSLSSRPRATTTSSSIDLSTPKPKAVKYTFISNKLNGNPIARRTLIYK